ncbi:SDR family NAD(P)-dependent oxidoreductase [Arthrobacter oryzae]|jgi:NAD(P)-dependent dehydrogenase (short-subunit alcohol dehydrogenase family)|uniref:SDR family NAD(P)-dependent oxidoreductase n=1 Tax=Arthrobacter oryzae TaxID=409290 RepID=UPI0027841622|nr:SDR family oxidoreductase [Arthrobacter oryzae]MDQ0076753.1 NAD(P)-dependent dehydrogenase (short-subunit alcohol dehydrogenase family) [Arthrobacter oryzae]
MPAEQHAVVTGCSSGIGNAIARRLLADGWAVTGLSRSSTSLDGKFEWLQADLAEPESLAESVAGLRPANALVHAAGFQRTAALGALDPSALAGMFSVHVAAASVLANALVPSMPDGGRVLLLGSRTSTGSPGKSHYAATKAALMGLGRTWAQELAPRGITVNVLSPGPTDTPMLNDPGRAATPVRMPALGALVAPEDVAALAAFLLGPHGKSITGQNYVICGGASL